MLVESLRGGQSNRDDTFLFKIDGFVVHSSKNMTTIRQTRACYIPAAPNLSRATPRSRPPSQAARLWRSAAPCATPLTASSPSLVQNQTSKLAAHSGRVLPAVDHSSPPATLVGAWRARALRPHGREVRVGREDLPLPVRTPVVLAAVRTICPRERSPARLRQEGLCPL